MIKERIEVDEDEVIKAVKIIVKTLETEGIDELVAYMAMIHVTKAMEDVNGFGHEQKADA